MKKILGLTMLTMLMVCCDVGPRQTSAGTSTTIGNPHSSPIFSTSYEKSGMEYRIFSVYNGGMCVINVTKDELEVELLQLQIDSLKGL